MWVAVAGTLAGAIVGFAAAVAVPWIQRRADREARRETRRFVRADLQRATLLDLQIAVDEYLAALASLQQARAASGGVSVSDGDARAAGRRVLLLAERVDDKAIRKALVRLQAGAFQIVDRQADLFDVTEGPFRDVMTRIGVVLRSLD